MEVKTVSLCVVAYNEEYYLSHLLNDFCLQNYPHDLIEILLIDSLSTDKTLTIMTDFKKAHSDFYGIKVLSNPKKKQACGWNVAIDNFSTDVMIRIDAHSSIKPNFVSENMKLQNEGEYITGGPRPCVINEKSQWQKTLLLAEESMFGSSIANYRRDSRIKKSYVNSLFHGAYKREVLNKVGHFNENLGRTEDNEFHYRIRQCGYKICYSTDIQSFQYARSSLRQMIKQKFGNGFWVALTLKVCPRCLSLYHFIPLFFVLSILTTTILSVFNIWIFSFLLWSSYICVCLIMSFFSVKGKKKHISQLFLPIIFFVLHCSYGIGSILGVIKLPFWKYINK